MSKIEVVINGKAYPCRQTMGAMLRFKKETGKEVTDIVDSPTDMLAFLYCCTQSACAHDGVAFDMDLMAFADSITPDDLNQWTNAVNGATAQMPDGDAVTEEKKS